MFNALLKKRKSNKGFTLIELIVVIAILAILALLLVPRFLGFTDNARIASDNAAVQTLEKSVMSLVASQEIKLPAALATVTIPDNDATAWTITGGPLINAADVTYTGDTLEARVEQLTGNLVTQSTTYTGFTLKIDTNGDVTADTTP